MPKIVLTLELSLTKENYDSAEFKEALSAIEDGTLARDMMTSKTKKNKPLFTSVESSYWDSENQTVNDE